MKTLLLFPLKMNFFLGKALLAAAMLIFTTVPAHHFWGGISAKLKYFLG